jgi:hypothetical protein
MRGIKRSIFSSEKPELNGAGDGARTRDDLLGRRRVGFSCVVFEANLLFCAYQ